MKHSKSMRSLKEVSSSYGNETNTTPRPKLKHSKSMRSLKNRDMARSERSSTSSDNSRFSSNTLRRILKLPDILRLSSSSVNKSKESEAAISTLKSKSLLKGFENPVLYSNYEDDPEQRLSKLLVNSQPFSTASRTRLDAEFPDYENPYENLPLETETMRRKNNDINRQLNDFYSNKEGGKNSIFKNLTLRLKRKVNKEKANVEKETKSDEYEKAGLYISTDNNNTAEYANVPLNECNEAVEGDPDFAIPRPKLIVPVHTYGIRKRRTGNMLQSVRTRSDETSNGCGDSKKSHHSSCPGMFCLILCPPDEDFWVH